jgi:hypothetical protein
MMKLGELMSLMSCKNGDELFEKIVSILARFDIEVVDSEGNDKSFYTLCCDVAKVLNKESDVN